MWEKVYGNLHEFLYAGCTHTTVHCDISSKKKKIPSFFYKNGIYFIY